MSERKLQYKDRFVTVLNQVLSDRFDDYPMMPDLPFPDMTTRVNVMFNINQEEYTKMYSALAIGAELKFGDESHELEYIFEVPLEAGAMTCEDVADCIETSDEVAAALIDRLNSLGYGSGNSESIAPVNTLTPAQTAENLLPDGYSCSDGQLMATARGVISAINQGTLEFLSNVEMITDPAEFAAAMIDNFEVVSWFSAPFEAMTWVQDELLDVYEASYTQVVEDTLSCALYCLMKADCELTLDMLLTMYESEMGAISPPTNPEDPQDVVDWLLELDLSVSQAAVSAFHYFAVNALRFGKRMLTWLGMRPFSDTIAATMGLSDNSYTICDDCPPAETPDSFWYMDFDFRVSSHGFAPLAANCAYLVGGWQSISGNPVNFSIQRAISPNLMTLAGIRSTSLRRGSTGNGTFDFKRLTSFPNENFTGTATQQWNSNFISENDNEVVRSKLDFVNGGVTFKSIRVTEAIGSNFNILTATGRIYKIELWGWNNGDVKPDGAIWVASRV